MIERAATERADELGETLGGTTTVGMVAMNPPIVPKGALGAPVFSTSSRLKAELTFQVISLVIHQEIGADACACQHDTRRRPKPSGAIPWSRLSTHGASGPLGALAERRKNVGLVLTSRCDESVTVFVERDREISHSLIIRHVFDGDKLAALRLGVVQFVVGVVLGLYVEFDGGGHA